MSYLLKKTSDSLIGSFLVSDLSDLLTSLTKKEGMSESLIFSSLFYKKHTKKKIYNCFSQKFLSESLIRSFIMSDLSDPLLVAHLSKISK